MQKPLNCNQDWSKMTPAEGGRICGSCEKLIVDFRKKSWKEIENKQAENNNSLCGVYSEKQLKHWGKEVPSSNFCSKTLLYASMVLSMNTAVHNELQGQTNVKPPMTEIIQTDQQTEHIENNQQPVSDSLITITGRIVDKESGEPLISATVLVKNTTTGTIGNIEGNFTLKDLNKIENITLVFSYVGYETQEMVLNKNQVNQRNLALGDIALPLDGSNISVFYVTVPNPWKKAKKRVTWMFRNK